MSTVLGYEKVQVKEVIFFSLSQSSSILLPHPILCQLEQAGFWPRWERLHFSSTVCLKKLNTVSSPENHIFLERNLLIFLGGHMPCDNDCVFIGPKHDTDIASKQSNEVIS